MSDVTRITNNALIDRIRRASNDKEAVNELGIRWQEFWARVRMKFGHEGDLDYITDMLMRDREELKNLRWQISQQTKQLEVWEIKKQQVQEEIKGLTKAKYYALKRSLRSQKAATNAAQSKVDDLKRQLEKAISRINYYQKMENELRDHCKMTTKIQHAMIKANLRDIERDLHVLPLIDAGLYAPAKFIDWDELEHPADQPEKAPENIF